MTRRQHKSKGLLDVDALKSKGQLLGFKAQDESILDIDELTTNDRISTHERREKLRKSQRLLAKSMTVDVKAQ